MVKKWRMSKDGDIYKVFHIRGGKKIGLKSFINKYSANEYLNDKLDEEEQKVNQQLEYIKGLRREARILHFW